MEENTLFARDELEDDALSQHIWIGLADELNSLGILGEPKGFLEWTQVRNYLHNDFK